MTDEEFRALFERCGPVRAHRILRKTACAFIDYMHIGDAALARETLPHTLLGSMRLRVEFKCGMRSLPQKADRHLSSQQSECQSSRVYWAGSSRLLKQTFRACSWMQHC